MATRLDIHVRCMTRHVVCARRLAILAFRSPRQAILTQISPAIEIFLMVFALLTRWAGIRWHPFQGLMLRFIAKWQIPWRRFGICIVKVISIIGKLVHISVRHCVGQVLRLFARAWPLVDFIHSIMMS